jgi:hypothetical protein
MEELRAELRSAFIAVEIGIARHPNCTADCLKPLNDVTGEVFRTAADVQHIVDMVFGFHPDLRGRHEARPENRMPHQRRRMSPHPNFFSGRSLARGNIPANGVWFRFPRSTAGTLFGAFR